MTDTDALTSLRSSVAQFDREEKLALVGFLALECTPRFGWSVFQEREPFSETLENAFEASTSFSLTEKLSFAIELLQFCQDEEEDEGDGLPDPTSDYEGEEYYSSGRPLLGGYNGDVDIDALPGFHQGY